MTNKQGKTLGKKILGVCEVTPTGKGNIMPQLLRMMNPKEIRKVPLMKEKIEKNIIWFLFYPVQL